MQHKLLKLGLTLTVAASIASCKFGTDANKEQEQQKNAIYNPWAGEYISVNTILDDKKINSVYESMAKQRPNYTLNGIASYIKDFLGTKNIKKLKFQGDSIEFTFAVNDKIETVKYTYQEIKPTTEKEKASGFYKFKAIEDNLKFEAFRYIYTTKPHKDDEKDMLHFHFKNSSEGFETLEASGVFPTFTLAGTSKERMLAHYKSVEAEILESLPNNPLDAWEGEHRSLNTYLGAEGAKIEFAYIGLINKYKGENAGKDYTKQDIKKVIADYLESEIQQITLNAGSNKIQIKDKLGKAYTIEYLLDYKNGEWTGFTAKGKTQDAFKHLIITEVEGIPPHFHYRNGTADFKQLENLSTTPTFLTHTGLTLDSIAKKIQEFGDYLLKAKQ